MFLEDYTGGTLEHWTSTDGIHYTFVENIKSGGNQYKNPFIWLNPNDNKWYLYSHDSSGTVESIKVRSATSITGLRTATDTIVVSNNGPLGSPSIMYYNGRYWLLGEVLPGSLWQVVAYYSTTSPTSGFVQANNSPILTNDEACPMLFMLPGQTRAFLYTTANQTSWYEETREINLTSSILPPSPTLTNYQMRIVVNYGSGTSSADTAYLGGHCQTDFSDIRFTWFNATSSSEVECSYWIENSTVGSSAVFWVKVPQISGTSNSTIYIYYGKTGVATTSNGTNTFEFFDDFSGTLSKWTAVGGTWQIQNGQLVAQINTYGQRLRANNFVFANDTVHAQVEWTSGTYFENAICIRGQSPNEQSNGYMTFVSTWSSDNRDRISSMSNGVETTLASQGTTNPSQNVWYTYVFSAYGNTLKSTITPLYPTTLTVTDNTFSSGTLCLFDWSAASETAHYDNVFVTKSASQDPIQGNWYSEETGQVPVTVSIDNSTASGARVDVASIQTVAFHAQWNNGSSITSGNIYINGTQCAINSTGWARLTVNSSVVTSNLWTVTAVNCGGVTAFTQTAANPQIIWDQMKILSGGLSKSSASLGDSVTVWFTSAYQFDNTVFDNTKGTLYVNSSAMTWSTTNNRWEYSYAVNAIGTTTFKVSSVLDNQFGLIGINDAAGPLNLVVLDQPFFIVTNSTVSQLSFNSTSGTLAFTVSGPSGSTGFLNLTIAKSIMPDLNSLTVNLDGNPLSYISTSSAYYWSIQLNYHHSTHSIVVNFASAEVAASNPNPTQSPTVPTQNLQTTSNSNTQPNTSSSSTNQPQPTPSTPTQPSPTTAASTSPNGTPTRPSGSTSNMTIVILILMSVLLSASILTVTTRSLHKIRHAN